MFAKSIFAIALVALSVSASPVQVAGTAEAALLERSLVPEFLGLNKRESRTQAANRIALAKKRAAKKAKRALAEKTSHELFKRALSEALAAEPVLSKRDMEARDLRIRALRAIRCGNNDAACATAAPKSDLPANGALVCSKTTHTCAIGCNSGFIFTNGVCVSSAPTCGANACPAVNKNTNGIYTCAVANGQPVCTLACNSQQGYLLNGPGDKCINPNIDPTACGPSRRVCPPSYNSRGTPDCLNGLCRLACDPGTSQRSTKQGGFYYCT